MKNFDLEKRLIDFSALIINIVNDEIQVMKYWIQKQENNELISIFVTSLNTATKNLNATFHQ